MLLTPGLSSEAQPEHVRESLLAAGTGWAWDSVRILEAHLVSCDVSLGLAWAASWGKVAVKSCWRWGMDGGRAGGRGPRQDAGRK